MTSPSVAALSPPPAPDVPSVLAKKKPFLFDYLATMNVIRVDIAYDGEGDSGQIADIDALSANDTYLRIVDTPPISFHDSSTLHTYASLHDYLEAFSWDVLEAHHAGFEINDGGFGRIVIDVRARTVTLEKSDCHVTFESVEV